MFWFELCCCFVKKKNDNYFWAMSTIKYFCQNFFLKVCLKMQNVASKCYIVVGCISCWQGLCDDISFRIRRSSTHRWLWWRGHCHHLSTPTCLVFSMSLHCTTSLVSFFFGAFVVISSKTNGDFWWLPLNPVSMPDLIHIQSGLARVGQR